MTKRFIGANRKCQNWGQLVSDGEKRQKPHRERPGELRLPGAVLIEHRAYRGAALTGHCAHRVLRLPGAVLIGELRSPGTVLTGHCAYRELWPCTAPAGLHPARASPGTSPGIASAPLSAGSRLLSPSETSSLF